MPERRCPVPTAERLAELVGAALPFGLRSGSPRHAFHRDLYFDTPDGALRRRGASCRIRFDALDRRWLRVDAVVGGGEARGAEGEPRDILLGAAQPPRRPRAPLGPPPPVGPPRPEGGRRARTRHL